MCIVSPVAGDHKKKKQTTFAPNKTFHKLNEHCLKYLMIRKLQKNSPLEQSKVCWVLKRKPHQPHFYSKMV